ncbi:MAG TPA: hypothetical protein VF982_01585 [Anaerolineales bacterium]
MHRYAVAFGGGEAKATCYAVAFRGGEKKTRLVAGSANFFLTKNQSSNPRSALDNNALDGCHGCIHAAKSRVFAGYCQVVIHIGSGSI